MILPEHSVEYWKEQFRHARPVLFTGAGFSGAARNRSSRLLPTGYQLAQKLWAMLYPRAEFDERSTLQDLFENARATQKGRLTALLEDELLVQGGALPDVFASVFSLPWYRVYTLNVDNICDVLNRHVALPRRLRIINAVGADTAEPADRASEELQIVHLNGRLLDGVDRMTFSTNQYAERLAVRDPWYEAAAADILTHPVVFVGTTLSESPLVRALEMRRRGTGAAREHRRRSVLVTKSIDIARQSYIEREFRVQTAEGTLEEFNASVFQQIPEGVADGFALLRTRALTEERQTRVPSLDELLAVRARPNADYYLGNPPTWADVLAGLAVRRDCEEPLWQEIESALRSPKRAASRLHLLVSTAGNGKTTMLMRTALRAQADGNQVNYLPSSLEIGPRDLRTFAQTLRGPHLLILDSIDRYGIETGPLLASLIEANGDLVVLCASRASRIDRVSDALRISQVPFTEHGIAPLTNGDIDRLLDVLARENRLLELARVPRSQQEAQFRERADRQLLVALYETTRGKPWRSIIADEMADMDEVAAKVYRTVAVATSVNAGLTAAEVCIALHDVTNEVLSAIALLDQRGLIREGARGRLRLRHQLIAEAVFEQIRGEGQLRDVVQGVIWAASNAVSPRGGYSEPKRRLSALISHDFLYRTVGDAAAAEIYSALEERLGWSSHYWLQRGSLALETHRYDEAELFLANARGKAPDDALVITAVGKLQLALAVREPSAEIAAGRFEDGIRLLEEAIATRKGGDPHQFDIVGVMSMQYAGRSDVDRNSRREVVARAKEMLEAGRARFPSNDRLRETYGEVLNFMLGLS